MDLVDRVAPVLRLPLVLIPFQEGLDGTIEAVDAGWAALLLLQYDQEFADVFSLQLADIEDAEAFAKDREDIQLFVIEFKRAARQVARAAGVQINGDPFTQIVFLEDLRRLGV